MTRRRPWRWIATGTLALTLTPLLPIGLPVGSAPAYAQAASVGRGYDLLLSNQIEAAIAVFEQLVRQSPNSVDGLTGLGIAYRRAGRDADALETYQRLLAVDPDNRLALGTLGLLGEFRPEWQPIGLRALTRLLELDPDNLEARAQRAKLYYYQGLFSQSLADYALVLPRTADPTIVGPAAEAHTFSGDYATGLALFDRYRAAGGQIAGDQAIAYAQALRESGQLAMAIQLLERALGTTSPANLTPAQARLRGALASNYAANRQFQAALDMIQPLRGRSDTRLTLARALGAIGDYGQQPSFNREAANLYRDVLADRTVSLTPGVRREASFALGNLPEHRALALQLVTQLAQELPQDRSLTFQQQLLTYQLGQTNPATFVQQVRATFPALPPDPVQVRTIGQLLSRLDPPLPDLLPFYQSLVAGGATEAFLQFRIAQILLQQGRIAEARTALSAYAATPAGSRDPETTQLLLADLDRREGNVTQSAQRYEQLLASSQSPGIRAGAIQGLAAVYQTQGRFREAVALYDQLIAANPQEFAYPLGRAALAYQAGLITEAQAVAVLNQGIQQYAATTPPPELITLATALPPSASRAGLYQSLLALDPGNGQLRLRALQVLADSDPAQAEAQATQLVAANPALLDGYFVLGEIAQQTGNDELARQSYLTVLQRQPNNADALLALAGLEFQAGNFDQAGELYRRALAIDRTNGVARTSLAALNAVQGRPLLAIQQLQAWQREQAALGLNNAQVNRQIQQIQEGLLLQRGIQPEWERF